MDYKNVLPLLGKMASNLEGKGLLKEAEMLDVVSNTMEKEAYESFMKEAYELLEGQGHYNALLDSLKSVKRGIADLAQPKNDIEGFITKLNFISGEPFKKIKDHLSKAKQNIYRNNVSNEFSKLSTLLEGVESLVTKSIETKDPSNAKEILENLEDFKTTWEKMVPAIDKKQMNK